MMSAFLPGSACARPARVAPWPRAQRGPAAGFHLERAWTFQPGAQRAGGGRPRGGLRQAALPTARPRRGLRCRPPMTVKESFDLAGTPTTWGHPSAGRAAAQDALVVQRTCRPPALRCSAEQRAAEPGRLQSYNAVYGTTGNPGDWAARRADLGRRRRAGTAGLSRWSTAATSAAASATRRAYCGVFWPQVHLVHRAQARPLAGAAAWTPRPTCRWWVRWRARPATWPWPCATTMGRTRSPPTVAPRAAGGAALVARPAHRGYGWSSPTSRRCHRGARSASRRGRALAREGAAGLPGPAGLRPACRRNRTYQMLLQSSLSARRPDYDRLRAARDRLNPTTRASTRRCCARPRQPPATRSRLQQARGAALARTTFSDATTRC